MHLRKARKMKASLWLALGFFFVIISDSQALFEDEAGVNDWHKKNIGRITSAHFAPKYGNFVVSSEPSSVIASIDSKSGDLIWRHVLDEKDPLCLTSTVGQDGLLSVAGPSGIAQYWDLFDGSLLWDIQLKSDFNNVARISSSCSTAITIDASTIYIARKNSISSISAATGKVNWSWAASRSESLNRLQSERSQVVVSDIKILDNESIIVAGYVINLIGSKASTLFGLELSKDGIELNEFKSKQVDQVFINYDAGVLLLADAVQSNSWNIVSLLEDGQSILLFNLSSGQLTESIFNENFRIPPIRALSGYKNGKIIHGHNKDKGGGVLLAIGTTGKVDPVLICEHENCAVSASFSYDNSRIFGIRVHNKDEGSAQMKYMPLLGPEKGEIVNLPFLLDFSKRGAVNAVFPIVHAVGDSVVSKALLLNSDDSLLLIEQTNKEGKVAWIREESLASIVSIDFVDNSVDNLMHHHIPTYPERLQLHWLEFKSMGRRLFSLFFGSDASENNHTPGSNPKFGLSKLAVAVTKRGKLCAISTLSGEIVWSRMVPGGIEHSWAIYVTRPRPILGYNPEFALISKKDGEASIQWFDALLGVPNGPLIDVIGGIENVVPLDLHDSEGRQILMIVERDNSVQLAPPSKEAYSRAAPILSSLFHHKLDSGGLSTFSIAPHPNLKELLNLANDWNAPKLNSVPVGRVLWDSERVVSRAYPLYHEVIQSPAVVLGDDSLLLKYLNPHLVVVATLAPFPKTVVDSEGFEKSQDGGNEGKSLTIWLIDTVSGRVLYQLEHEGAAEPVHCVVSENNVVCTYWSARARRTEVSSMSLYEGMIGTYGLSPTRQPERLPYFSSFGTPAPVVLQKTYILPHSVTALGLPLTAHGITSKNIFVAIDGGQILSLDRRLLEPRRPMGEPNKAEKEEKLVQWWPIIPVVRQQIVTYGNEVARASRIVAAPTKLESTSVLLACGLDLFCTRATPSKTFDLLAPTFNYSMLLLVVFGLLGANIILGKMAQRKNLASQWA